MTTTPQPTPHELIASVVGNVCPACARHKRSGVSFCNGCYDMLDAEGRKALYKRVGNGYEQSMAAALATLGKTFIPAGGRFRDVGGAGAREHVDTETGEVTPKPPTDATIQAGRRAWQAAMADGEAFRGKFPASCYARWEIAGSVRRQSAGGVKDVEHVIIPAFGDVPDGDSLFAATVRVNLLWHHLDAMLKAGQVAKHVYGHADTGAPKHRWGEKYRGVDFRGFNHEIFSADLDNWGSVLAIRTGPAEFSHRLVIDLQKNGYVNDGGYVWKKSAINCPCGWAGGWSALRCVAAGDAPTAKFTKGPGEPVVCPKCGDGAGLKMDRVPAATEEAYFRLCGRAFVPPTGRSA